MLEYVIVVVHLLPRKDDLEALLSIACTAGSTPSRVLPSL